MRSLLIPFVLAASLGAQAPSDGPLLRARHLSATANVKLFVPAGSVRLIGWDRDSIVVRGSTPRGVKMIFVADDSRAKLDLSSMDESTATPSNITMYVPRRAQISAKTVTADITASNTSGWFYSVSGDLRFSGDATSVDALSMSGNIDVDATTSWLRARTGSGHLLVRGAPQDVDASTVSGTLDIAAAAIIRGQFASVSGNIHYVGTPARGAIFDISNHSGNVELMMPPTASGVFLLTTVVGSINESLVQSHPVGSTEGGHTIRLILGRGDAHVTVRTFKGAIEVRQQ